MGEKKSSFIKDWQKDLKEFFSLRKKKPSTTSTLELPVEEYETETIGEISNVNDVERKIMEGNKIPEEAPCDVPSIENIEHADKSTKDSDKATAAERRKNKRKTNSDSCETNPFKDEKLETKVSEPEPEDAVE